MKEKISHLLESKKFYLAVSILVAVLYWLVLSLADDSDIEKTIYDVPVQLDYNASTYQGFDLEIIGEEPVLVDVVVSGPRTELDGVTADDLLIYPNVNSVTTVGTKVLRLVYGTVNSNAKYAISRLSQDTVTLRFDKIITQTFPLQLDGSIQVESGYMQGSCVVSPSQLSVTGPSQEVSAIQRAWVTMPDLELMGALDTSVVTRGEIRLLNEEGEEVDGSLLTLDSTDAEVNINILRRIEQPLKVQFTNVPRGFDTNSLGVTLDRDTVAMAVPTAFAADMESEPYPLYIDFYDIQTNGTYQQDRVIALSAPEGCQLLDNLQQVTVSFDTLDYHQKRVQVTDFRVADAPEGKQVTVVSPVLDNVILVGPADAIEQLEALEKEEVLQEYIYAQVDASAINIQSGQMLVDVQILVPSINNVFAVGTYTVVASVE